MRGSMDKIKLNPTVLVPAELDASDYVGNLYGYYYENTTIVNILAWDEPSRLRFAHLPIKKIGMIHEGEDEKTACESGIPLVGFRSDILQFSLNGEPCQKELYSLVQNIFSRNTGILETDFLLKKRVIIVGCGSVGSLIALELARAGIGRFILVDNDILNLHNLCRHQCGIQDVGKFKVDALKERILNINPIAEVETFADIIENLDKVTFDEYCDNRTVIIGSADNREAGVYLNRIANLYDVPFVSVGFWERAFAGEIFYSIPSESMPCYECALGKTKTDISALVSANRRIYSTQEDLEKINFEPGISIDISFVTLVGVKLILDILNRDNPNFTPRVINYLTQYTLVCNTNDPKIGGEQAEIFAHPLQITNSIKVQFRDTCPPCKYR